MKTQRKVCGFDENDMKKYSFRRGLKLKCLGKDLAKIISSDVFAKLEHVVASLDKKYFTVKPGFHIVVSGLLRSLLNFKFHQKLSTTIWKHE